MRYFCAYVACTMLLCSCVEHRNITTTPVSETNISSAVSSSSSSLDPTDSAYGSRTDIGHIRLYGFSDIASPADNFKEYGTTENLISNDNYFGDYMIQVPLGNLLKNLKNPHLNVQISANGRVLQRESMFINTLGLAPYAHFLLRNFVVGCQNFVIQVELIAVRIHKVETLDVHAACQE